MTWRQSAGTIWAIGIAAYLLAVFHRSSLAVAGLEAADRFDISAAQLSGFTTLQLIVYAGLQVPVGVALDRFGPRRVMLLGAVTLTVGQACFAIAESYGAAVGARVLVGAGDAMTFTCVLRLVTAWFPARRIPMVTQITGVFGQVGALLAALPMTWAFGQWGWTRAYLATAALGLIVAACIAMFIHDEPGLRIRRGERITLARVRTNLAESWSRPGTRLGFWTHFATMFSASAMLLLWGHPFFVRGENRSEHEAGVLLTVMIIAIVALGPVVGGLSVRHSYRRSDLIMVAVMGSALIWTVVLVWPGEAPTWLLGLLVLIVAFGPPASAIAFDYGREANPGHRLGTATGIINQGGFIATLVLVVAIGVILDWRSPDGSDYTPEAFRWAMAAQYPIWALGLIQIWRYRRRARAELRQPEPS